MGTDITTNIERYNKEKGEWENLSMYIKNADGEYVRADVYVDRDYNLFSILAGVRGDCDDALVSPRGVPDNLSDVTKEDWGEEENYWHSATWYDYCELSAYEHMMNQLAEYAKESKRSCNKDEGCGYDYEYDELLNNRIINYNSLHDFMNDIRFVLDSYNIWYANPGDIRIIVWFNS